MVKTVCNPDTGHTFRLGRTAPVARTPRPRLSTYALASLPTPPSSIDYTAKAARSISQVYLNDQLGDCVIAGGFHIRGVTSGNADGVVLFSQQQVVQDYAAIGGYNGTPASDQGCNEDDAVNYWIQHGFPDGLKLAGGLSVDATNQQEVQTAIWLFENVMFGVALPDAWLRQSMPRGNGFVWDVAGQPDPNNGHCFVGGGYNAQGVIIYTWGMWGVLTWRAVRAYSVQRMGGELHTLLSPDSIIKATGKAPSGFNFSQLVSDFDSMGGHVPIPAPPPDPIPDPTPPPIPQPPSPDPNGGNLVLDALEIASEVAAFLASPLGQALRAKLPNALQLLITFLLTLVPPQSRSQVHASLTQFCSDHGITV